MVDVSQDPRVEAVEMLRRFRSMWETAVIEEGNQRGGIQRRPTHVVGDALYAAAARLLTELDAVGGVPEPSRDADYEQIGWRAPCCSRLHIHPLDFTPSQMHTSLRHGWITEPVFRRLGDDT